VFFLYNAKWYDLSKKDLEDIEFLDKNLFTEEKQANVWGWDKEDHIFYLTKRNSLLTVARKDKIVGFCLSILSYDESDLYKIIVNSDFRSKGIGSLILVYHLFFLRIYGIKYSFLEVAENNFIAQRLYTKVGYRIISVRKNYYGKYDSFVMRLVL